MRACGFPNAHPTFEASSFSLKDKIFLNILQPYRGKGTSRDNKYNKLDASIQLDSHTSDLAPFVVILGLLVEPK